MLKDRVGDSYLTSRLLEIYEEGSRRYECDFPPGYKDRDDKGGPEQYGDLVLWFQIIDKAREVKMPVVFVTDDDKEDWWWKSGSSKVGPRPELIKEFHDETGEQFYMYSLDRFHEHAGKYLGVEVTPEVEEEILAARKQKEELLISQVEALKAKRAQMRDLLRAFRGTGVLNRQLRLAFEEIEAEEAVRRSLIKAEQMTMEDAATRQALMLEAEQSLLEAELARLQTLDLAENELEISDKMSDSKD